MKKRKIIHRKPNLQFTENYPKHWHSNSPFKTHFLNSLTLIFPTGEKYFIRSIKCLLVNVQSEILQKEAKLFIKQESEHFKEHEKFFKVLKKQGYKLNSLVDLLDHIVNNLLEPYLDSKTNLSITAGLEHITALLAEISLEENFLDEAPQKIQDLFNWHAAEEIEHRAVAFDVLKEVTRSYSKRIQGIIIGYIIISSFSALTTTYLLYQDKELFKLKTVKDCSQLFFTEQALFIKAIKIFLRYLDPDFHPDNEKLDNLSSPIFNSLFKNLGVA
ncbi:MAG: metal-dependent hydrolase [Bacteriovoracaceae bacterium]|jgi:uncharacterized protein|nr:metal-dependent hydrolase [Bacteriovoracaceae bacterium]